MILVDERQEIVKEWIRYCYFFQNTLIYNILPLSVVDVGFLGQGNCQKLPACVLRQIREAFLSQSYVMFTWTEVSSGGTDK